MSEEKFYYGAIDFWEENKELDSLHLLNKFIEEKYLPKLDIIKEVREYIENNSQYDDNVDNYWTTTNELLEILDKVDKEK